MTAAIEGGSPVTASRAQAAADITTMHLGTAGADTYTAYYDDWVVCDSTGDFPVGPHHNEALIPSADGTHSVGSGNYDSFTTTAFTNGTTNGNTFLGHRPLQLANTAEQVIRQAGNDTASYMEFTLENLAAGASVPIGVTTYVASMEAGTGNSNGEMRLLLSDNTEVLTTGSVSALDVADSISNTVVSVFKRLTIPPSGGWDRTKVDGLKVRVGFADGAPDVNFIDFMVTVALTEPETFATPSKVSAIAAVPTPSILRSTTAPPSTVGTQAAVPTPTIRRTAAATPARIAAVAAVPTPSAIAGGNASANPAKISAQAAVPTPSITATAPSTQPYHYSDGYGQGYETIEPPEPVVVPPPPPPSTSTPTLRVRVDWEHDLSPVSGPQPEPTWTDISSRLLAQPVSIQRGRKRLMDRIEAGQLALTFRDDDRALDPSFHESPYYPGVGPDRRIRVEAVLPWETDAFVQAESFVGGEDIVGGGDTSYYTPIYDGMIEELTYDFPGPGKLATVTMRCSDMLALASRDEVGVNIPATYVWIAYEAVLDARAYLGRDASALDPNTQSELRDIDQDTTRVAVYSGTGPWVEAIDLITASGGGNFFIGRDGRPTYRSRAAFNEPTVMSFAVDAERYRDVQFSFDNALVVNDVTINGFVTDVFGANQPTSVRQTDEASKQRHPGRPAVTIETILADSSVIAERARETLANNAFPLRYIAKLEISQVSTDWINVLSRDLWDRINLAVALPNGDVVTQSSLIEGIDIETSGSRQWTVSWWLSVPPYIQILTEADKSFEYTALLSFTAQTNCTIEATNQEWSVHHSGRNDHLVAAYRPLSPPHGQYALWVKSAAAGPFFTRSGAYGVVAGGTYYIEYKVRAARFLEDQSEIVNYYNTVGPFQIGLEWYNAAMTLLSTDLGPETFPTRTLGGNIQPATYTDWSLMSLQKRAPTGAAFVRIKMGWTGTGRSGFFMDDGLFTRVVS
jgi:hypothetical protein